MKTFATPGTYTVTLTTSGPHGSASVSHNVTIDVVPVPPSITVTASPSAITVGGTTTYSASVDWGTCTPTNIAWSYSDISGGANGDNTSRTYATPGTYSATATVTGDCGEATGTAEVTAEMPPEINYQAAFTNLTDRPAQAGLGFDGTQSQPQQYLTSGDAYAWDFGDWTFGSEARPPKTYNWSGDYDVQLTVTGPKYPPFAGSFANFSVGSYLGSIVTDPATMFGSEGADGPLGSASVSHTVSVVQTEFYYWETTDSHTSGSNLEWTANQVHYLDGHNMGVTQTIEFRQSTSMVHCTGSPQRPAWVTNWANQNVGCGVLGDEFIGPWGYFTMMGDVPVFTEYSGPFTPEDMLQSMTWNGIAEVF